MKTVAVVQNGLVLFPAVRVADRFLSRFRGLMGRSSLAPGEGLLLKNCGSIHCFFMRFTIDAVYLDRGFNVVAKETVRPWRIGGLYRGARHVLELPEGAAGVIAPNAAISLSETETDAGRDESSRERKE